MWVSRVAVLALLGGCSASTGSTRPDAMDGDAEGIDASEDGMSDAAVELTCDFTEAADATNDTTTNAELTGLTLATRITMCGSMNNGHFDSSGQLVDADFLTFTIASETDVVMHVFGAGIDGPDDTIIQLRQGGTFLGFGVVEGDHGTLNAHLPAGEYSAAVASFNATDLAAPIPYKLTIVPDLPDQRCAKLVGSGAYAEMADGASNNGNDVIDYNSTANTPSSLSASSTDAPEQTGFTVGVDTTHYQVTGISELVDPADDYEDRDTFAFTTGPATTQMSIRLNWAATTVDLDYRVYPQTAAAPLSIVGGLDESPSEYEFETFAVKPSTTYWLWIAAEDGATGQPAAYGATLCGSTWSP
jgi:hypothetical protein